MTTYTKPAVRNAWGQTATGADLVDPGNTYASAGWQIGVKPPRQYFNWVLNYTFSGIRYLCQQGITEWDAAETYRQNAYVTVSGYLYCSLINNNINNNPATTFGTAWSAAATITPIRSVGTWQVPNIAYLEANFLPVGSAFTAISGSIQNGQVPVGAVTQWQGSLSIGGGQVTSAVARANTVNLINGNAYLTFNWNGQAGQPTWLFGSNDGANAYVWNPANFSVANANTVAGLSVTSAASGSTVMARDGSGYAYAQYFNQASGNNEGTSISQFMVTNGSDGYLRKVSVAAAKAALGALTSANFAFSSGGYQKIADQAIIQGGRATVSGLTAVFFPIAFPHGCFAVVFTNEGSTNQIFLNSPPGTTFFQATNGSAVIDWIAFGW